MQWRDDTTLPWRGQCLRAIGKMQEFAAGKFHFEPPSRFTSLDHLVRSHEHSRWHGQAERPGGLKVDDRFVLSRCLHWKVGGLNTAQDAVDIGRSLPKLIDA